MNNPLRLQIIESGHAYPIVKSHSFCDLPQNVRAGLNDISYSPAIYPAHAILFVEGQNHEGCL